MIDDEALAIGRDAGVRAERAGKFALKGTAGNPGISISSSLVVVVVVFVTVVVVVVFFTGLPCRLELRVYRSSGVC